MKIYTKTGDAGQTGLFGGPRVPKNDPRIEAYGAIDELNAALGLARCESLPPEIDAILARVQNELFDLGAELATPDPRAHNLATLGPPHIGSLEAAIDRHETGLPPLKQFILPGGTRGGVAPGAHDLPAGRAAAGDVDGNVCRTDRAARPRLSQSLGRFVVCARASHQRRG